jgi:hypothetical protein
VCVCVCVCVFLGVGEVLLFCVARIDSSTIDLPPSSGASGRSHVLQLKLIPML